MPSRSSPRGPCRAQPQHSRTLTWQPFTSLPKPKPTKSPNPQKNAPRTARERLGRECRLHSGGEFNERWKLSHSTPASPRCSLTPFCSPACWRQIEPTSKGGLLGILEILAADPSLLSFPALTEPNKGCPRHLRAPGPVPTGAKGPGRDFNTPQLLLQEGQRAEGVFYPVT